MNANYKIRSIRKKSFPGVTAPVACSLDAILKFDSAESPYCVYSELVALRLAQTFHIPVASGVLTTTGSGEAYASIELGSPGLRLPDLLPPQFANAASHYSEEAAALVAFDIFIGNWDRGSNIKASLVTPHLPIFQGFDHEHGLLGVEGDPLKSIERLAQPDLIVRNHPFFGHASGGAVIKWADRIAQTDDAMIRECCELKRALRAVTTKMQENLADALCKRKQALPYIVSSNMLKIRSWP